MSDNSQGRKAMIRRASFTVVPMIAAGALLVPAIAQAAPSAAKSSSSTLTGCLKSGAIVKIKKGAKPSSKCATGTTQVSWNMKGVKGATGATGAAGAKGAKGDKGDSGIAGYEVISKVIGAGDLGSLTSTVNVACPTGKQAIGGGVQGLGILNSVLGSFPAAGGLGWTTVSSILPVLGNTFYAVCATAAV